MSILNRIRLALLRRKHWTGPNATQLPRVPRRAPVTIDVPAIAMRRSGGFSLIELLVAVGIAAILSALAAVAYAGYSTRASASEGTQLAQGAELAMTTSFQDSGNWPNTNAAAAYVPQTGKYSNVVIDGNGNVAITFTSTAPQPLQGTLLFMTPYLGPDGQTVAWACGTSPAPLFGGVAGTLLSTQAGVSTTPVQFLPKVCHA